MVANKPFSQYLAEAQAKYGTSQPKANASFKPSKAVKAPAKAGGFPDPLTWFVDIISRPVRSVQNVSNTLLDEELKRKQAKSDNTDYNEIGGFFNVVTSPFRGLLSMDPKDQPTGAKLIEKQYDVENYGRPGYIDEANNVNEVQKAAAGFAMDVALDPLTYLPYGVIASGIRGGVAGAKAATGLGKVSGAAKGVVSGTPNAYKLGAFTKNVKPVGLKQWSDLRSYEKVHKLARKQGFTVDEALKVSGGAKAATVANEANKASREWAKQTGKPATKINGKSLSEFVAQNSKLIEKAKNIKGAETAALATAASSQLAKAAATAKEVLEDTPTEAIAKASANIPANVRPAVDSAQMDSASLMDQVGPPVGSTEAEQWAKAVTPDGRPASEAISGQLARLAPRQETITETVAASSSALRAELNKLTRDEARIAATAPPSKTAADSRDAKLKAIRADIRRVQNELKGVDTPTQVTTTKKFSSWDALQDVLADPVKSKELSDTLGAGIVDKLAKIENATTVTKLSKFLDNVIAGNAPKTDNQLFNDLANELRQKYDVKIPGTNANRIQETSSGGTAEAIVGAEAAAKGETAVTSPWLPGFSEETVEAVFKALPASLRKRAERLKGFEAKGLPRTTSGALRDSTVAGKGTAEYDYIFGTRDQVDLWRASMAGSIARINSENTAARRAEAWGDVQAGRQRSSAIWKESQENVNLMFKHLDSLGATLWLGEGNDVIRLHLDQFIDTFRLLGDPDIANAALLNLDTSVPITNLLDAAYANIVDIVRGGNGISKKEFSDILRKKVASDGKKEPFNVLTAKNTTRYYTHKPLGKQNPKVALKNPPKSGISYLSYVPNIKDNELRGFYGQVDAAKFEEALIERLQAITPDLIKIADDNAAMAANRLISDEKYITPVIKARLEDAMSGGERLGDAIRETANIAKVTTKVGADERILPEAQLAATKMLVDSTPADQIHEAQTLVKGEKIYASGKPASEMAEDLKKLDEDNFDYNVKYAEQLVDLEKSPLAGYDEAGNIVDEGLNQQAKLEAALNLTIASRVDGFFNIKSGVEDVIHPAKRTEVALLNGVNLYKQELETIIKNPNFSRLIPGSDTPIYTQAFRDFALGVDSPLTREAVEAIQPLIERVVGTTDKDRALTSLWMQGRATFDDLEAYMKRAKVDSPFERDIVAKEAARTGKSEIEVVLNSFYGSKSWVANLDNPLQWLERMHYAASMMIADKATARLFNKIPNATSTAAKPGFVKMPKNLNPLDNPFLSHMQKDVFINEEMLSQVLRVEKVMMADRSYSGPFADFINNQYLPVIGNWKFGVTVLRLGHHIRNFFSDTSIQIIEEGMKNYARSGAAAHRVMMAMRAYDDVDFAKTLQSIGDYTMPTSGTKVFDYLGKDITTAAIAEAAEKNGIFINLQQLEDLLGDVNTPGFAQKASNIMALRGTFIAKAAGNLSEYQNHYNRLHHFIQFLMNNKDKGIYKTWDDLVEAAAIKVRTYHPDSSMLAPGESKLRLLFPFYSWFRLSLPVILESIIANPGRFAVIPKASYNLAVAMGVNPESIQEPFPKDQLFPDFLREQMLGPVIQIDGKYYGINPGIAHVDLLNTLQNPVKGITGLLSPAVKAPIEIINGARLGSSARINDFSDYVDSQLPGINYLSNISGTSVTGSLYSVLTGQGLDPQYAVDAGNKTPADQAATLNSWFTGITVTNMSKPNFINLAEIEARNKAREEAERQAGTARSPF